MLKEETVYLHNGKEYKVVITRKRMRTIRYYYKDGTFKISAPFHYASKKMIMDGLNKYADKLINLDARELASGDNFIYLLGHKISISFPGEMNFSDGSVLEYKDREQLEKKLKKWFLEYITSRNQYYEQVMGIRMPYKVRVRKMTTRYGSNSKSTHSITYSLVLMHYSCEIIDSVIVHELAHHFVRDHSQKFYNVVYQYCPNYKVLHKRLRKVEF